MLISTPLLFSALIFHFATARIKIGDHNQDRHIVEGAAVELPCEVAEEYEEKPTLVHWSRNGATVASFVKKSGSAQWWTADPRLALDRGKFSLSISSASERDQAVYACSIQFGENSDSEPQSALRLDVIMRPSAPGRPLISSTSSRSLSVRWGPSTSQTPILRYLLAISEGHNSSGLEPRQVQIEGNRTWTAVSGLKPYTVYRLKVKAENMAGLGAFSLASDAVLTKGERPVGAPKISKVLNATNTSIILVWTPPPSETLHGPLVGFRIMAHKLSSGQMRESYLSDPSIRRYELKGLDVYTKYMISIEADNNFGYSPSDTVIALTEEGVPGSAPLITNGQGVDSFSLCVTWTPPLEPNGRIIHYILYVWKDESERYNSLIEPMHESHSILQYTVTDLKPYTEYSVQISAATVRGEGPVSNIYTIVTDVAAPSAPTLVETKLLATLEVELQWKPPDTIYRQVDFYSVELFPTPTSYTPLSTHNFTSTRGTLKNRLIGTAYYATVKAVSKSVLKQSRLFVGQRSEREAFMLQALENEAGRSFFLSTSLCNSSDSDWRWENRVCDPGLREGIPPMSSPNAGIISLAAFCVIGAVSLILLAICLFLLFWRRKLKDFPYAFRPNLNALQASVYKPFDCFSDEINSPPIPVPAFYAHFNQLKKDGGAGFAREFQEIEELSAEREKNGDVTSEASRLPENKCKNRYINIAAYDHSRVHLRIGKSGLQSDYINANYIDGYRKRRAFIATQGPLPATFSDFWYLM